jgi:hypothetical protein
MPEGGSRRRRGFCCWGQPLADCDFNLAALHPAYPIKRQPSEPRKSIRLDPLECAAFRGRVPRPERAGKHRVRGVPVSDLESLGFRLIESAIPSTPGNRPASLPTS